MECISSFFVAAKQIVKGLGETLVGAYPGRAMSFITKKTNLMSPIVRSTFPYSHLYAPFACINSSFLKLTLVSITASLSNLFIRWTLYESDFQVIGYPSKLTGLYSKQSVIFRSDSNGEDLEGYAGAGLYDRLVMKLDLRDHYNNEMKTSSSRVMDWLC